MFRMRCFSITLISLVFSFLCTSAFGSSINIDYDSLTTSELKQIISNANEALERNHSVSSSVKSSLESKVKINTEKLINNGNDLSWRWFDWTYIRDWNVLTVITEVKVNGNWPYAAPQLVKLATLIMN